MSDEEERLFEQRKGCVWCETKRGEWWWYCSTHDVWECDGCSMDVWAESGPPHRFVEDCDSAGVHVKVRERRAVIWCG